MRTINLIPENYDGNPREALGYSWSKLVMDGYKIDREQSIPGEDLKISADECYDMLESEHGTIAIRPNGGYGWTKKTAKLRDGREIIVEGLEPIATINGMWCGGISVTVFVAPRTLDDVTQGAIDGMVPAVRKAFFAMQSGDTLAETATKVKTSENIELMRLDEEHKDHPGWCKKCHSFCYGDCDAN